LLYPLAEHTVSSSITGMMNGALPVVVAVVTAIWIRTMPSGRRMFAVLIGFCGILLIALPSINDGSSADVKGIARPIQAIYTPGTLMLHVEIVAFVMSAPYGVWGFSHSTFSLASFSALAVLAVLGTGFAFVLFAA
jgi:drug/metabolite transporter (DMT)-like permease